MSSCNNILQLPILRAFYHFLTKYLLSDVINHFVLKCLKCFKEALDMTFWSILRMKLGIWRKLKMNVWPSYQQELWQNLGKFSSRIRVLRLLFEKLTRSFYLSWIWLLFYSFHAYLLITPIIAIPLILRQISKSQICFSNE